MSESTDKSELSLLQGRLCILAAAVLWSLSSLFSKVLSHPTWMGLHEPKIEPLQMAFYRVFFAMLVLIPLVRKSDISFRPTMLMMGLTFALMNAFFISAMVEGSAAKAILLQYSAPLWMYLAAIFLFKEMPTHRDTVTLILGLLGIGIIVWGDWKDNNLRIVALGLGSGITFGGILLFLRVLRDQSSSWLTVWNHCFAVVVLSYFAAGNHWPNWSQLGWLFLFGSVQLGIPYFLMARGLRVVHPSEAGAISLLEPVLNPIWAYLVSPGTETPKEWTYIGGVLILCGLGWRYWPRNKQG